MNADPAPGEQEPLYRQVRRQLLEALAAGEWKIGDRLPAEPELARRFGVAVSTLRAGIAQLVSAGVLSRRQGRGTYVTPYDASTSALRFSNIYDGSNCKVSTVRSIRSIRRLKGDPGVRAALQLQGDAQCWHLEGALYRSGSAVATIDVWLPADRFAALREEHFAPTQNLYAIYQQRWGVTVLRMAERVHARVAEAGIAERIGVPPGTPLLHTERVAFSFDDAPVELRRRSFDGRQHHYLFTQDRLL